MSTPPRHLSAFGYTDYRQYLKDFYAFRKESERGYSFRQFSKDAGFTSPNMLKLVMDGDRNLTRDSLEKFVKGLRLEGAMADYFRALVRMNQAETSEEKTLHYNELKRLTPNAKKRDLAADTVEYLSHWLYPVLREMCQLSAFQDDPYWIARRLNGRATVKEISAALRFLLDKGFVTRTSDGRFVAEDNMVLTSDEVRSLAIRSYHKAMLDQAKDYLDDLDTSEREYGALTFLLPSEKVPELKFKMKEFRRALHLWALESCESHPDECVVQVNMQMYPQTKRGGA